MATIKPVLKRESSRLGGSLTESELTEYAQYISDGTTIKVKTQR